MTPAEDLRRTLKLVRVAARLYIDARRARNARKRLKRDLGHPAYRLMLRVLKALQRHGGEVTRSTLSKTVTVGRGGMLFNAIWLLSDIGWVAVEDRGDKWPSQWISLTPAGSAILSPADKAHPLVALMRGAPPVDQLEGLFAQYEDKRRRGLIK